LIKRLNDKKFVKKSKALHVKRKKELKKVLKKHFKVYKSDTNFFMVKSEYKNIFDKLLKNKILVRTCGSFDFLDDSYLRFAVKDKKDIKVLEKVLETL
jgi:threonine-phosphate decarboxylase